MILYLIVLFCLVSFSQGDCSLPEEQAREHKSEGVREEIVRVARGRQREIGEERGGIEEVRRRSEARRAEYERQEAEFALRRAEIARQEAEIALEEERVERDRARMVSAREALEVEIGREAVERLLEAFGRGENVEAIIAESIGNGARARR